jgi:hypothetical protein
VAPNVKYFAHALAKDEKRKLFTPSFLMPSSSKTRFFHEWFPGRHSDIGGHKAMNPIIARITLAYMIRHAISAGVTMDDSDLFTAAQVRALINTHFVDPGPENADITGLLNEDGINWSNIINVLFSW